MVGWIVPDSSKMLSFKEQRPAIWNLKRIFQGVVLAGTQSLACVPGSIQIKKQVEYVAVRVQNAYDIDVILALKIEK